MIKRYTYVIALIMVFFACSQPKKETTTKKSPISDIGRFELADSTNTPTAPEPVVIPENVDEWTIIPGVQFGKIKANTTFKTLAETYGKENVLNTSISLGKEIEKPGTKLYPNTVNEILILWKDENSYKEPLQVMVKRKGSEWKTYHGIKVGSTFEEVVKANERPFEFMGFGYEYQGIDYSGQVTKWNGGRFNDNVGLTFGASMEAMKNPSFQKIVTKEGQTYRSNESYLEDLNLVVEEIRVTF